MFFGFKTEFEIVITILCAIGIAFFIVAFIDDKVEKKNRKNNLFY